MHYYKSEKEAAYFALKMLESKLPAIPKSAVDSPEWGTTIFRWKDVEGGYKYAFQEPYQAMAKDGLWEPLGRIPSFPEVEVRAYAHTHPNNTYFSNIDLETARGERGLVKEKTVMYMVNKTGAYWYDGRTEELQPAGRHGLMWGEFPK
ncbi:MAG: hypothetical protein GEU91_21375 [Rhizobiales bacterium]|nr:hypothetical protein [Hyphomicrobiales bacterium]